MWSALSLDLHTTGRIYPCQLGSLLGRFNHLILSREETNMQVATSRSKEVIYIGAV